jgi:hypothetical protein
MRKTILAGFLVVALGPLTAQASLIELRARLDGAQEVPPSGSVSTASAAMTYDDVTMTLSWSIGQVTPFFGTGVIFAHFHGPAAPGVNAAVQVWICANAGGGPVGTPSCGGAGAPFAAGSAVITSDQANALLAELWYINIHTAELPGGEIRGQVLQAPAPATLALLGLGLLGVAYRRRQH